MVCCPEANEWIRPTEAAHTAGTDTKTLRRWVAQGLVSVIHRGPNIQRRYLKREMEEIARLAEMLGTKPSVTLLSRLVEEAMEG
jgi:DNA-binding transcriptional MerR regulator